MRRVAGRTVMVCRPLTDGGQKIVDCNNYIYCTGRSMVSAGWNYRSPD